MPVSAPGQTTGFNSTSDYLDANQGTLDREAGDVNGLVNSELDAGKTAADQFAQGVTSPDFSASPGYLDAAAKQNAGQSDAELTKSEGGLQDLLGRTSGGHGANAFDAQLLGLHGGFKDTQDRAQTLHGYLDAAASAPKPGAPPATAIPDAPPDTGERNPEPTNHGGGDAGPLDTPVPPGGLVTNSGLRRAPSIYGGF